MISIYTDGAYSPKRKKGGSAYAVIRDGELIYADQFLINGGSNNTAELSAIILALSSIKQTNTTIQIYSDSMYVIGCGWNNWSRKKNVEHWKLFDSVIERLKANSIKLEVYHVDGHQTDESEQTKWNNFVDRLATKITQ